MPFIPEAERVAAMNQSLTEPGHRCYRQYQHFMYLWNASPRWRTIDEYAKRIWENDETRAAALALLVFMHEHGMEYERLQKEKNGDVK